MNIQLTIFIDEILITASSTEELISARDTPPRDASPNQGLGFLINI